MESVGRLKGCRKEDWLPGQIGATRTGGCEVHVLLMKSLNNVTCVSASQRLNYTQITDVLAILLQHRVGRTANPPNFN
jgi:hypothetical protein